MESGDCKGLPKEIWGLIFSELRSTKELRLVASVCKSWRPIAFDPMVWKALNVMPPSEAKHIEQKVEEAQTLTGHTSFVFALAVWNDCLMSVSYDASVRGWDEKGEQVKSLVGHTSYIFGVAPWKDYLVTGCYGSKLILWKPNDEHVVTDHGALVYAVMGWGDYLITASFDNNIRKWELTPSGEFKLLTIGSGHTAQVQCLRLWNGQLYSGSWDGTIRVWDDQLQEKAMITPTPRNDNDKKVRCLIVWNDKMYCGTGDGLIHCYDSENNHLQTIKAHDAELHCLAIWNGLLFSGDWSGCIKAWDDQGRCVLRICSAEVVEPPVPAEYDSPCRAHSNAITTMKVWKDRLYTGSYDNTIKVWKWKE